MDQTSLSNHQKVLKVLDTLENLALDLPTFLHCLSYGDIGCIKDPRIQAVRTGFFHSPLLPQIMQMWYNPPNHISNSTTGARPMLQQLAFEWVIDVCNEEFMGLHSVLKTTPVLSEANLLETSFDELSSQFSVKAVHLSSLLRGLACAKSSENSRSPDRVSRHILPVWAAIHESQIVLIIVVMLAYHQVQGHHRFQQLLSIYWFACGVPSKAVSLLHTIGLAMNPNWVQRAIPQLSNRKSMNC